MREYYYLKGLADSPYNLTTADALHLGATRQLRCYFYLAKPTLISHLTTNAMASTEPDPVMHDGNTLQPLMYWETVWARSIFLRVSPEVLAGLESTSQPIPMDWAELDDRCNGMEPVSVPFIDSENWPQKPIRISFSGPESFLEISASNVICWADDLERLAEQGLINRHAEEPEADTDTAPSGRETGTSPDNMPEDIDLLLTAWRVFWLNASQRDKSTWPLNDEVERWLTERGMSGRLAKPGTTMIKPDWARKGGRR